MVRAAIGREARCLVSEKVLVFLRGPSPNPVASASQAAEKTAAAAAVQPAMTTLAIGREARHPFSEKITAFLRGPNPNPAASSSQAAASVQPVEKAEFSMRSAISKRSSASRFSRRATRGRKMDDMSLKAAVPWFMVTLVTLGFLEGFFGRAL